MTTETAFAVEPKRSCIPCEGLVGYHHARTNILSPGVRIPRHLCGPRSNGELMGRGEDTHLSNVRFYIAMARWTPRGMF